VVTQTRFSVKFVRTLPVFCTRIYCLILVYISLSDKWLVSFELLKSFFFSTIPSRRFEYSFTRWQQLPVYNGMQQIWTLILDSFTCWSIDSWGHSTEQLLNISAISYAWAWIAQSVQQLAADWTVWVSNPGGGEIFRTRPDRSWGPPSLLCSGYRVFPGGKTAGAWRWPPTPI
jgi:hypothetical protein